MKEIIWVFAFLSISALSAQNTLTITVSGIDSEKGKLQICLYDTETSYMKTGQAVACQWVEVGSTKEDHAFDSLPSGKYAVIVIHDLNDNGSLDTNLFRIPKEPYGFSNNPSTTFGPPDFEGASFHVVKDTAIVVKLK